MSSTGTLYFYSYIFYKFLDYCRLKPGGWYLYILPFILLFSDGMKMSPCIGWTLFLRQSSEEISIIHFTTWELQKLRFLECFP